MTSRVQIHKHKNMDIDYFIDNEKTPRTGCFGYLVVVIVLLALLIGITSCRTSKKVSEVDNEEQVVEVVEKKDTAYSQLDIERRKKETDRIVESMSEDIVTVWFSAPDSNGVQYKTSEQRIVRNANRDTKKECDDSMSVQVEESSSEILVDSTAKIGHYTATQVEEKKPGALQNVLAVFVGVVLLLCIVGIAAFLAGMIGFLEDKD